MITIKNGIGEMIYTENELKKELNDLDFLRDAFLVILNEKQTKKSDLPFNKKQVLKLAKKMYKDLNYCDEFIKKCFN